MPDSLTGITAHGGRVERAPCAEGTLQVALFADPARNVLRIWQETTTDSDVGCGIQPWLWVERLRSDVIAFYTTASAAGVQQVGR